VVAEAQDGKNDLAGRQGELPLEAHICGCGRAWTDDQDQAVDLDDGVTQFLQEGPPAALHRSPVLPYGKAIRGQVVSEPLHNGSSSSRA
jgi:hypothetical protein